MKVGVQRNLMPTLGSLRIVSDGKNYWVEIFWVDKRQRLRWSTTSDRQYTSAAAAEKEVRAWMVRRDWKIHNGGKSKASTVA